jgi:deazaflavin-dependent oxidoreductase (nitroreductase family)
MSELPAGVDRSKAEAARAGDIDLTLFGDRHVEVYESTGGAEGFIWNGAPILVLTTAGEKTGKERKFALIYAPDGDDVVIVASKGGAPEHPQWYRNLVANPEVTVQVRDDRYPALARTATPEEKKRLWPLMTQVWPSYDDYQQRTDRDIPVVILSRR